MWGSSFVKSDTEGFAEGIVEKRLHSPRLRPSLPAARDEACSCEDMRALVSQCLGLSVGIWQLGRSVSADTLGVLGSSSTGRGHHRTKRE